MILEQNHFPGATNRWLAPWVNEVCVPSEEARRRLAGRGVVTGNPVRAEFASIGPPPGRSALSLLVFGGSRGSRTINRAMVDALADLAAIEPVPRIVHQTGAEEESEVAAAYRDRYPSDAFDVLAFLDDMPARVAAADLILCRAGATTLAELAAAGRPAILVPYPHAADDHQARNADSVERGGAAVVVRDSELTGHAVLEIVKTLGADRARLGLMAEAARRLAMPAAASRIVDLAERLLSGRGRSAGADDRDEHGGAHVS